MGKKVFYVSYEKAKEIVRKERINNVVDYYKSYKALGLPSHPQSYYEGKGWTNWNDFFGKSIISFPNYAKAKEIIKDKGIKTLDDYLSSYKALGLPSNPRIYYKDSGWTGWNDFCDYHKESKYPVYEVAQEIVKKEGIKNGKDYKERCHELNLPVHPDSCYEGKGWINWYAFLGNELKTFPLYEEAKKIVQRYDINTQDEYLSYHNKLRLPAHPQKYYKDKGWIDWDDFFGRAKKITSEKRTAKVLTKVYTNHVLLKEDTPLQVVYMIASHVDKKFASKIEELLGKPSCEERLEWVKEQLKELGVSPTSKPKTTFTSASGMYSAMSSVFEELGDDKESLPDETISEINSMMENYMHNLINRELIEEYDG